MGSVVLQAKGDGVQIYGCTDGKWALKGPDARLLDALNRVIGKHFAGPAWQLNDGSVVKGALVSSKPAPDGVSAAWLLLKAVPGSGSGKFATVAFIRRTETHGGAAPARACAVSDVERVPYTATYTFYAKP